MHVVCCAEKGHTMQSVSLCFPECIVSVGKFLDETSIFSRFCTKQVRQVGTHPKRSPQYYYPWQVSVFAWNPVLLPVVLFILGVIPVLLDCIRLRPLRRALAQYFVRMSGTLLTAAYHSDHAIRMSVSIVGGCTNTTGR
ncbi:uncharacterized protein LAESUDRAFT_33720 [Laetiporus sulphureus 93-53]|uniref:Uncharacterized protein n=1 Tax=Laetiporus sulphureus 93-53 TaxID=1314785 RepID=A0A165IK03_9APHY|nr:uncharacterized protein LAESUDRAFT_33720 [Laetiporus sulphureus 93-53]KZT13185.1 hypothetical protein LAESUDRAFT_33720 [Laetiporus sulphureus 93-53]